MSDQLKLSLKWSCLAFIAAAVLSFISYAIDYSDFSMNNYIGLVCLIAVLVFGAYEFRDKFSSGYASAKQLLKSNILIVIFFAVAYSLWTLLFVEVIDTEMWNEYLIEATEIAKERGADVVEMQEELAVNKKVHQPFNILIPNFLFFMLFGGLASLSIAAILKKNKPENIIIEENTKSE